VADDSPPPHRCAATAPLATRGLTRRAHRARSPPRDLAGHLGIALRSALVDRHPGLARDCAGELDLWFARVKNLTEFDVVGMVKRAQAEGKHR
jgi:hypothetical protein